MSQCNMAFDLKMNLGHSDLYFIVQRFFFFHFFFLWNTFFFFFAKLNSIFLLANSEDPDQML